MATPAAHIRGKFVIPDESFGFFSWLIPFGGCTLFALASLVVTNETIGGVVLFLAIYFYWGFRIVDNTGYLVIERFGEFSRIVLSGPRILCLPGLIDKVVAEDTLRYRELALFADEDDGGRYAVDFKDASSPVAMKASYRIGPQVEKDDPEATKKLINAIYLFTYTMRSPDEREERIEEVLESATIPQLQALETSAALLQKDTIAESVTANEQVRKTLEAMGVELNPQKGLIISDIDLPQEVIELRQKKLQGASEAEKQSAQGLGYARSIKAIMNELNVGYEEARSVYETQRGLETLGTVEANVSFVAPDMRGIQKVMGVGNVGSHPQQPKTAKEVTS